MLFCARQNDFEDAFSSFLPKKILFHNSCNCILSYLIGLKASVHVLVSEASVVKSIVDDLLVLVLDFEKEFVEDFGNFDDKSLD